MPTDARCQICNYSLAGLPDAHTCPECGTAYDPHSAVIRLACHGADHRSLLLGVIIFALVFWPAITQNRVRDALPCGVTFLLLMAAPAYRCLLRHPKSQHLVFLDQHGIRFDHPDVRPGPIPWHDFAFAKVSWITGRFRIVGTSGRTLVRKPYCDLGSLSRMRDVVETMNRLARIYKESTEASPPTPG